jgi:hypothetical protein
MIATEGDTAQLLTASMQGILLPIRAISYNLQVTATKLSISFM